MFTLGLKRETDMFNTTPGNKFKTGLERQDKGNFFLEVRQINKTT